MIMRLLAFGCTVATICLPTIAQTIIGISGPFSGSYTIFERQFEAISWTTSRPYTNVNINVSLDSTTASAGTAFLTTRIGPGTVQTDVVAQATFVKAPNSRSNNVPLFSGLSLSAGTYYLVLSAQPNDGAAFFWSYSASPLVQTDSGVTDDGWSVAVYTSPVQTLNAAFPPASVFEINKIPRLSLLYNVTNNVSGPLVCGATNVTAQTQVTRSGFHYIYPSSYLYSANITVTNTSASPLQAPLFVALDGLPQNAPFPNFKGLLGSQIITHCNSAQGSYLIPIGNASDLMPGQSIAVPLVFVSQSFTGGFSYSTRVFSGMPNQ